MKGFFAVIVLLLVGTVCFGFYRGWFGVSSENADHKSTVTFSVDQDKLQADEEAAKKKVHDLGHKVKEATGKQTGTVKEEDKDNVPDAGHKVKEKTGDRE
jgi:hypothetical protein